MRGILIAGGIAAALILLAATASRSDPDVTASRISSPLPTIVPSLRPITPTPYYRVPQPLPAPFYFYGYPCTEDCSGHEAGYEWAEENGVTDADDCGGNSDSFIEGCQAYVEENVSDELNYESYE